MKKILITGGTTFVSKYAARYFVEQGSDVYVLNRNSKPQVEGVTLIEGDRHKLGDVLKDMHFDAVVDITAYDACDIADLLNELGSFEQYIMVSSGAVYPDLRDVSISEEASKSFNAFTGSYGMGKAEAEDALLERVPNAYILRPAYLYGAMNNLYREAFVFDCAKANRKFYLPGDGKMKLQFFHVRDLCKLMEVIVKEKPADHIFNVGNVESVSIRDWVTKCYACLGKKPEFVNVFENIKPRCYFCFDSNEYYLDVQRLNKIFADTIPLDEGLNEAAEWYVAHEDEVNKKPYFDYIDLNLKL